MIDLDAIRERDRGCSPGAIHRPSLYWAVQDRRALLAEADRLRAELGQPLAAERERDELRAQVESLQSRWASRPLSHPDGEALEKENERLRNDLQELTCGDERYTRLGRENERLRAELAIVTRDRDTLLQMTGKTVQQVADEINRLRSSRS